MRSLKISILDVGHGDFIYSTTPLGDNLIIDCGTGETIPSKFLSDIQAISELQISHPHINHFDDISEISKKISYHFDAQIWIIFLMILLDGKNQTDR